MFKMMALDGALVGVTLKIGALTKLGLFFPMVCSISVFHQTLAEQVYRDTEGLLRILLRPFLTASRKNKNERAFTSSTHLIPF